MKASNGKVVILGAGMTGLNAALTSGAPIYEAAEVSGGICSSYYMRPNGKEKLYHSPKDGEVYRFEIGGGHWIFGGDPTVLRFIRTITPIRSYARKSSVYFPSQERFVPYPLQNHLCSLGREMATKALSEMASAHNSHQSVTTMAEWLQASFGPTLCELFFEPFHNLYTAGLWRTIAPQDAYKSPVSLPLVIRGAFNEAPAVGYNATFIYPVGGLNTLAQNIAAKSRVHYGKRAVGLDVKRKEVYFADGSVSRYEILITTLPLNAMMEIADLKVDSKSDPYTSVLVTNVGAIKGPQCPEDHWVYVPQSRAGFHRVGFYNNVEPSFLPRSVREIQNRTSIYVERAYPGGQKPNEAEVEDYCRNMIRELQEWGWIEQVEVMDPTWIDVAYTWSWPSSQWTTEALKALESHDIYPVGRYARWIFQGIADSIRDGFIAGSALSKRTEVSE